MKAYQHLNMQGQMSVMKKTSIVIRLILIGFCLAQVHCTPPPQSPPGQDPGISSGPQVSAILRDYEEVIRTIQNGQLVPHRIEMKLFSGNRVEVYSNGWAELDFLATGTIKLVSRPYADNTCKIRILSPSIFIEIGEVLGDVRNTFEFQTRYLISETTDAKFDIGVYTNGDVNIGVRRGSVTVRPRSGAWGPVTIRQGEYIHVKGDQRDAPQIFDIPG